MDSVTKSKIKSSAGGICVLTHLARWIKKNLVLIGENVCQNKQKMVKQAAKKCATCFATLL